MKIKVELWFDKKARKLAGVIASVDDMSVASDSSFSSYNERVLTLSCDMPDENFWNTSVVEFPSLSEMISQDDDDCGCTSD
jgi:hypothetical protein